MLKKTLVCVAGHQTETTVRSDDDFKRLTAMGLVTCGHCGSTKVGEVEQRHVHLTQPQREVVEALGDSVMWVFRQSQKYVYHDLMATDNCGHA